MPEPSVTNIGSGKVSISILVSYVRLMHFQGSYETGDFTRTEIFRDLRIKGTSLLGVGGEGLKGNFSAK